MWHSVPAAAVAGLLAYLAMPCYSESVRVYKSVAVVLGFLVHLAAEEVTHGREIRRRAGIARGPHAGGVFHGFVTVK